MKRTTGLLVLLALAAAPPAATAQRAPGHSVGKVTVMGDLIHIELDSGVVAPARLFDLDHRTLRFTPDGNGYRVENVALSWDSDFGPETSGLAPLKNFRFPFSGRDWDTLTVSTGAITFGQRPAAGGRGGFGGRGGGRGGFPLQRYSELRTAGGTFINAVPGIAAFVRISNSSPVSYFKELSDRAVVTWDVGETVGGTQAFTWVPVHNHYQATLHSSGVIELSYNDMNAKDAIVGVFPMVTGSAEQALGSVTDAEDTGLPANLDVRSVRLASVDGLFVKATVETRGPVLPEGNPGIDGVSYRIALDSGNGARSDIDDATAVWTVRGVAGGRGGGGRGGAPRYIVSGPGAQPEVTVSGNTLSVMGVLPEELAGAARVSVSADAGTATGFGTPMTVADAVAPGAVALTGIRPPEMDLSSAGRGDGPFRVAYEGFHWMENPSPQNITCTVINALGDNFDFLASYSTFRVDNPEGGTPSTGPRGGNVSGIGTRTNGLENFCSQGRFQWQYVEPVSTAAVQIQEKAPADTRFAWMTNYNYAISQIGHELGHRWAADAFALLANGDTVDLGNVHWAGNVHLASAFSYSGHEEADAMGGSYWKDNGDGTFTQLDRDFYSPAKGFSWLALYLMGLAKPEEVPPFFVLQNQERIGQDADGHPIVRADKQVVTIEDVIRAMGPREPDFDHAQKEFNTAIVIVTRHGEEPPPFLVESANNIADRWIDYWSIVTGGRSTMTTDPRPQG